MKELPKTADKARLEWSYGLGTPQRQGNKIGLPKDKTARYFSLNGGSQFIIDVGNFSSGNMRRVWFGGTDEEPFLVEMNSAVADYFIENEGSVESFYNRLVPENVLSLSDETGIPYKRQGDIFAAKFCGERYFEDRLAKLMEVRIEQGEMRLLGTRHVGKGRSLSIINGNGRRMLFTGVVEAPDHKPMNLSDGLYLIGQTREIVNPAQAD